MKKLPVTVISGFLGSGKTTLLQNVLENRAGLKVAVIVNDMSEVNIDAATIRSGGAALSRTEEALVEFSNGCICCTLREDLLKEVARLANEGRFDYLLIESTGISEPLPVAETFLFLFQNGRSLSELATLDTMVTVVDAAAFERDFVSEDSLKDRSLEANEGDDRSLSHLLTEQVEFANVIALNKIDLVDSEQLVRVKRILRALNAKAQIVECERSRVPLELIVNSGEFDFDRTEFSASWQVALETGAPARPSESETYGIESRVLRARRPFHPARFRAWMGGEGKGLLRAKGVVWLSTRMELAGTFSKAGTQATLQPMGLWWAAAARDLWPEEPGEEREVRALFDGPYGDRRQELVLIGTEAQLEKAARSLDECLLSDEEFQAGPSAWARFKDPFPRWAVTAAPESHV